MGYLQMHFADVEVEKDFVFNGRQPGDLRVTYSFLHHALHCHATTHCSTAQMECLSTARVVDEATGSLPEDEAPSPPLPEVPLPPPLQVTH